MYINLLIGISFCSGFMKKGRVGCDGAAEGMSVFTAFSQRRQVGCAKYCFFGRSSRASLQFFGCDFARFVHFTRGVKLVLDVSKCVGIVA